VALRTPYKILVALMVVVGASCSHPTEGNKVESPSPSIETIIPQDDGAVIIHAKMGEKLGTITIKRLGINNFPIKMGTKDKVLATSVGVYKGSPAPGTGNFMIAGHRITPVLNLSHGPFYSMDKLKKGDVAIVKYQGETYRYKVVDVEVVTPSNKVFRRLTHSNVDMTLTACHPIGSAQLMEANKWESWKRLKSILRATYLSYKRM
jgi:LPXTG-site transpeptidase (sortase) family protein